MSRYARGDAGAFESLYHRHRGALYRYILRHCSDRAATEELYQDVWLKLIDARQRYRPSASFQTFLYHIAHNRLVDHFRRNESRRAMTSLDIDSEDTPASVWSAGGAQPDRQLLNRRDVELLFRLIDQLPPTQREAFLLREETGMGVEEIAEVTGVGRETAKSRLRYAVKALRKGLQ